MLVNQTFRFRVYPTDAQRKKLDKQLEACRAVHNYFLRYRIDHYTATGKGATYYQTALALTKLKKQKKFRWLGEVSSQALQQTLRDLDKAYNNFFNKKADFPKFKSWKGKHSCRFCQRFKVGENQVCVPKIGWLKLVMHRQIEGEPKNLTLSRTKGGKYFVGIYVEKETPSPIYNGSALGLDLGLKDFAVTSDDRHFRTPDYISKDKCRLRRLQRKLARQLKGSKGWRNTRQKIACLYEAISNRRKDFQDKLSRSLVEENSLIAVEDLSIKNMMKNKKLVNKISNAAWGQFLGQLKYKGPWYGCSIKQVDRFFPSSKRCHICGFIKEDLDLYTRHWTCSGCNACHDRDENAAKNILAFATVGATESNAGGEAVLDSTLY